MRDLILGAILQYMVSASFICFLWYRVNKTDVICVGLCAKPVPPLSRSQISHQLSNFIYVTSYPRHSQSIVARAHLHTAGLTDCCQSVSPLIETKCSNVKLNNFSDFTTMTALLPECHCTLQNPVSFVSMTFPDISYYRAIVMTLLFRSRCQAQADCMGMRLNVFDGRLHTSSYQCYCGRQIRVSAGQVFL